MFRIITKVFLCFCGIIIVGSANGLDENCETIPTEIHVSKGMTFTLYLLINFMDTPLRPASQKKNIFISHTLKTFLYKKKSLTKRHRA